MSSQMDWNIGLVTVNAPHFYFPLASLILFTHQLSMIVLPLAAYYAIRTSSGSGNLKAKSPVQGHLKEVLAEDDSRKPKSPIVEYVLVCTASIIWPGLIIPSVIAVHGLGSEYPQTWTKDDKMWLKDFLPHDLPLARILAFVYPSESFNDPDLVDFRDLAGSLLRCIVNDREGLHSDSEVGSIQFALNR